MTDHMTPKILYMVRRKLIVKNQIYRQFYPTFVALCARFMTNFDNTLTGGQITAQTTTGSLDRPLTWSHYVLCCLSSVIRLLAWKNHIFHCQMIVFCILHQKSAFYSSNLYRPNYFSSWYQVSDANYQTKLHSNALCIQFVSTILNHYYIIKHQEYNSIQYYCIYTYYFQNTDKQALCILQ